MRRPVVETASGRYSTRMRYSTRFRVKFGHSDPAGVAYYPRYFEWFHDAFEAMFEEATGTSYGAALESGIGYPAVQALSEYRAPLSFGAMATLTVFLSRLTERSATFEYRLHQDDRLTTLGSVKVVGMDLKRQRAVPLPDFVHRAWGRYLEVPEEVPATDRLR